MSSIQKVAVVAVAIIAFIAGSFFSGGKLAGTTNYDVLDVDSLIVGSSSATSSTNLGKACLTMTESDGGTVYWYASATGNLATSSSSCN